MKMKHLIRLRKALKDVNSSKKLVDEVQKEIAINDRHYKERDKELKDLLKIISASQEIIESKDK